MTFYDKVHQQNLKLFEQSRQIDMQVEMLKQRSLSHKNDHERADLTLDDLMVSKHLKSKNHMQNITERINQRKNMASEFSLHLKNKTRPMFLHDKMVKIMNDC